MNSKPVEQVRSECVNEAHSPGIITLYLDNQGVQGGFDNEQTGTCVTCPRLVSGGRMTDDRVRGHQCVKLTKAKQENGSSDSVENL